MNRNVLDRKTVRKLEDLLEQHRKDIEGGKWTRTAFAEIATRRLGQPITSMNVKGAACTMGVQFVMHAGSTGAKTLGEMRAEVKLISREIVRLCGELGATCCPELIALSGNDVAAGDGGA